MKILRLILGDQLNHQHSWFQIQNPDICYLMMEMKQETSYVQHHVQKLLAFFQAMRYFAKELQEKGHQVIYLSLNNPENQQVLSKNIEMYIQKLGIQKFEYQLPDEYRLDQQLQQLCKELTVPSQHYDTEHFLTDRTTLQDFFKGKHFLMENFYRMMRKKYNILMEDGKPVADRWNYDADNRVKYKYQVSVPSEPIFNHTVTELVSVLEEQHITTMGDLPANNQLNLALNRKEALLLLEHFSNHLLIHFGTYEDAMHTQEPHLFHSRLSFVLNTKILSPLEAIEKAIEAWQKNSEKITIAQIEGFVRQILGWREYMRGVYWAKMPQYAENNFFDHQAKLPDWFWTGKTKMSCAKNAIGQSLKEAYAHHIQRLMVIGNIALLLGCHPDEVDNWYLGVYVDAIEWVEITNTRGMSQFADGGLLASKPYTASANYMDKMSNYCEGCFYDKKKKYGDKACPLNSLYWEFHHRHQEKLSKNPRIGMVYITLSKMQPEERSKILEQAMFYRENMNNL